MGLVHIVKAHEEQVRWALYTLSKLFWKGTYVGYEPTPPAMLGNKSSSRDGLVSGASIQFLTLAARSVSAHGPCTPM